MRSIINTLSMPRRAVLAGLGSIGLSATFPSVAFGLSEKTAVTFIQEVLDVVDRIINSGGPEAQMLVDFEGMFRDYGEVPLIAKTVLGAPGRQASSSQLAGFISAFRGYISRKYGRQFNRLAGDTFQVVSSRDAGSKGILIQSMVSQVNNPSYEVEWWVIEINGRPKLFDIKIEGISLISTERSEIGAMLESFGGDLDRLIANLNAS